jgi:hypothetical protein
VTAVGCVFVCVLCNWWVFDVFVCCLTAGVLIVFVCVLCDI